MAAQPRLIHPVLIEVKQLDTTETIYDDNAREPIQIAKRSPVIRIQAQMEFRDQRQESMGDAAFDATGILADEEGYALIRWVDAFHIPYVPQLTDVIIKLAVGTIGEYSSKLYVRRIKPVGHYPGFGSTLRKLYFSDRKPSRPDAQG